MFAGYEKYFHTEIPVRPGAKYAHIIVLRRTESYGVFKTDGELNTARVATSVEDSTPMTRLTIFKRKQSTPERLTGRELLRRYGIQADIKTKTSKDCEYNVSFCGMCPDDVLYGYAIGDSGSEKSKIYVDTAYSLTPYDTSHETFTLNAPYEDGTMTREGQTTNRFSEQDHVLPGVYFPSIVTLRDPTANGLAYIINNLRRTKLYGAQTTRTGRVDNTIVGIVFADGEIFSNLRLTQATYDNLPQTDIAFDAYKVGDAVLAAAQDLVKKDGVVYNFVASEDLTKLLNELDSVFTDEGKLETFLKSVAQEAFNYADTVGVVPKPKAAKSKTAPSE
jgi:CRISPR-associated protein Csc2